MREKKKKKKKKKEKELLEEISKALKIDEVEQVLDKNLWTAKWEDGKIICTYRGN